jgi:hypothetical protein
MRLPRLRFTIRRLMLVVAIAGLVMGGGVWGHRMWRLSLAMTSNPSTHRQSDLFSRHS